MNRTLLLPFLLLALLLPAPAQAARDKELQPMADSLTNYLKAKLQESEDIVNSRSVHEALIPQYKQALGELNPETANDNAVKELRGQVESMQNQLAEALALLRQKAANPTV